jgi:hypothetical protein
MSGIKFDDVFFNRLRWVKNAVSRLKGNTPLYVPQLAYLKWLKENSTLDSLTYHKHKSPDTEFYFSLVRGGIYFSRNFKSHWEEMATSLELNARQRNRALDNFILHELFHIKQSLGTETYKDSDRAESVLRAVDYHADANAALAALYLYVEEDPTFDILNWQDLYCEIIRSITHQMYVFDWPSRRKSWTASRVIRHLTWHLQYHRVAVFNPKRHFSDVQILFEPAINLRNLEASADAKLLKRDWPKREVSPRFKKPPPLLWLAMPNEFGIPKIFRFFTTDELKYEQLFAGIFDCDLKASGDFFNELFSSDEAKVMTGGTKSATSESPPPKGPPGPPPPGGPTSLFFRKNVPRDAPKLIKLAAEQLQLPNPRNPVTSSADGPRIKDQDYLEEGGTLSSADDLPILQPEEQKDTKRGTPSTG